MVRVKQGMQTYNNQIIGLIIQSAPAKQRNKKMMGQEF